MDLEAARKAVGAYGGFIEWARWRLDTIFIGHAPESLLPYSVECIEEACNIVAKHFYEKGNKKNVEDIERCMCLLAEFKDNEEAMLKALERLRIKKWYDCSFELIKSCRDVEKNHISGFFRDVPFEKVDFDNLNFYTARKIVEIYGAYLKHAHMCLSFIFCQQIPESLLPFAKGSLAKALTFYANLSDLTDNKEDSKTYTYGKAVLEEDYVDDEVAMDQLIKTLSDNKTRDSIIYDMKKFQLESGNTKYVS